MEAVPSRDSGKTNPYVNGAWDNPSCDIAGNSISGGDVSADSERVESSAADVYLDVLNNRAAVAVNVDNGALVLEDEYQPG